MGVKSGTRFVDALTADSSSANRPRQVPNAHYSLVEPRHFPFANILLWNQELAIHLGIEDDLKSEWQDVLSRNSAAVPSPTFAMCYGGHQFGNWAGQLGDGRAINFGDLRGQDGYLYELQLKGSGPTPYSRTADGYAVLRSSIREFLCSEAMYYLEVPTTRALSLSLSGEDVLRDMMYNGNAAYEPGAVVCRVAKNFVRIGNFEILAARKDWELMHKLIDFCVTNYYPDIKENHVIELFKKVCDSSCEMVLGWMRVGFVHGVMNTDNMSIIGDTIDFGPYGWIDNYDPDWTPNTTDLPGRRYRFSHQPYIVQWNLMKLANALAALVPDSIEELKLALEEFESMYKTKYLTMMVSKIGITNVEKGDAVLIDGLLTILKDEEIDMTIFFRNLADLNHEKEIDDFILPACYKGNVAQTTHNWANLYLQRVKGIDAQQRKHLMDSINPRYVLRNYIAQMVIDAAHQSDYSMLNEVYEMIKSPYTFNEGFEKWYALRPDWARQKVGCSMLSCSS